MAAGAASAAYEAASRCWVYVPSWYVTSATAVKAAVSLNDEGLRPLARGPAIRVGRAFGAEDEDCTLVLKPSTDERGRVRYMRSVTCAN